MPVAPLCGKCGSRRDQNLPHHPHLKKGPADQSWSSLLSLPRNDEMPRFTRQSRAQCLALRCGPATFGSPNRPAAGTTARRWPETSGQSKPAFVRPACTWTGTGTNVSLQTPQSLLSFMSGEPALRCWFGQATWQFTFGQMRKEELLKETAHQSSCTPNGLAAMLPSTFAPMARAVKAVTFAVCPACNNL